jgi:ATP-binding cassette subfamily B protein
LGPFRTLRPYFHANRWRLLAGLSALIVVDFLQLLIPRVIRRVVDGLAYGTATPGLPLRAALTILALTVGICLMRFTWRYFILGHARRVEEALRNLIFRHVQALSAAEMDARQTGDLMAHATNDVEAVRMAAGMGIVALVDGIVLGAAAIGFMLYINVTLTLIAAIPMPAVAIMARFQSREVHRRFREVQACFSRMTERVRESFAGIRVVKAYLAEANEAEAVRGAASDYVSRNMSLARITSVFSPLITLFASLVGAAVLFMGGRKVIEGTITTGDFVAFIAYLSLLAWPMMAIGWVINLMQRGSASMERINSILAGHPEAATGPDPAPGQAGSSGIEVRGLSFSYGAGQQAALKNVSMSVPAGSQVGIVGRTGSGKSTLVALLLRLYDPPAGTVYLSGTDLLDLPLATLRGQIAYVPQDTFLFSDTIRENIAFARPGASLKEIEDAARLAEVHAEMAALPHGYDSVLGEKGITLSGGQRQRVVLARALLAGAQVLLLDDALSAVDTDTELRILDNLRRLAAEQNRTVIMVSHRLAAVMDASRIYVLEDGRVAEEGTHQELLQRRGLYADVWSRQQLEAEIDREANHAGAEVELTTT